MISTQRLQKDQVAMSAISKRIAVKRHVPERQRKRTETIAAFFHGLHTAMGISFGGVWLTITVCPLDHWPLAFRNWTVVCFVALLILVLGTAGSMLITAFFFKPETRRIANWGSITWFVITVVFLAGRLVLEDYPALKHLLVR